VTSTATGLPTSGALSTAPGGLGSAIGLKDPAAFFPAAPTPPQTPWQKISSVLTPGKIMGGAMLLNGLSGMTGIGQGGGSSGDDRIKGPIGGPKANIRVNRPGNMSGDREFNFFSGPGSFAEGGEVEVEKPGDEAEGEIVRGAVAAIEGEHPDPEMAIELYLENFGSESFEKLMEDVKAQKMEQRRMVSEPDNLPTAPASTPLGYAGGGTIKGVGDGMSDSIPAMIDGRAPARIATDEHIIPADVVSHLGNGSSDAGHRLLKMMSENVRTARTGSGEQAPRIEPLEFLPAYA
jgi:hypothetical protein